MVEISRLQIANCCSSTTSSADCWCNLVKPEIIQEIEDQSLLHSIAANTTRWRLIKSLILYFCWNCTDDFHLLHSLVSSFNCFSFRSVEHFWAQKNVCDGWRTELECYLSSLLLLLTRLSMSSIRDNSFTIRFQSHLGLIRFHFRFSSIESNSLKIYVQNESEMFSDKKKSERNEQSSPEFESEKWVSGNELALCELSLTLDFQRFVVATVNATIESS